MTVHQHTLKRSLIPIEHYAEPTKFANDQLHIMWFPDELKVEKDIQDIMVNMTPAEKHGVITTLKLFSLYELFIGTEFWRDRFTKIFEEPEFQKMASVFSMTELAVHAPFYKKINELLHIDNEEFYTSYVQDDVLRDRIEFIQAALDSDDDLLALGTFSMIEGAVLYANFGYLKHFQSQGKNKLMTVCRGLNFSLRDENLHAVAAAWSYKLKLQTANLSAIEAEQLQSAVIANAKVLRDHEHRIVDMIFSEGPIDGITDKQLKNFIDSRIDECMDKLGYNKIFNVTYNPISEWFYKSIADYQFNDNFTGVGNAYQRNWDAAQFTWNNV